MAIIFHELKTSGLKNRRKLNSFLKAKIESNGMETGAINFIFCSDDYLLEINRESLEHDYYTDIITFDLSESSNTIDADIFISVDRVHENSQSIDVLYENELHRVIFHGILHLLGFNDKSKPEASKMRIQENLMLKDYFF